MARKRERVLVLMREWCSWRMISDRKESTINSTPRAGFVFIAFLSFALFFSLSPSVNLLEILWGSKPLSLSVSPSTPPPPSPSPSLSRSHSLGLLAATRSEKIAVHFDPQWMEASFSGCWQLNQPASRWWVSDYFQSTSQYVSAVIECQQPVPCVLLTQRYGFFILSNQWYMKQRRHISAIDLFLFPTRCAYPATNQHWVQIPATARAATILKKHHSRLSRISENSA